MSDQFKVGDRVKLRDVSDTWNEREGVITKDDRPNGCDRYYVEFMDSGFGWCPSWQLELIPDSNIKAGEPVGERLKVGQKVRILLEDCEHNGEIATLAEDDGATSLPYRVEFGGDEWDEWYDMDDLEAVEQEDEDGAETADDEECEAVETLPDPPVTVYAVGCEGPPLGIFFDLRDAVVFAKNVSIDTGDAVGVHEYLVGGPRDCRDSSLISISVTDTD